MTTATLNLYMSALYGTALLFLQGPCSGHAWAESRWIHEGVTGRLIYVPDAEGDRILDFSGVGYRGQGVAAIPDNVPNVVTVSPNALGVDDTANIQAAIDQVSTMRPGPDGYRGAIFLEAGTYDIETQLTIRASGVVLRGAGREEDGTVLLGRNPTASAGNNQRSLIRIFGIGGRTNMGTTKNMIDKVVPAGARSFRVDSTSGLAVGDTVRIERPSTQNWIEDLGMDNPPDGDPPWVPGGMNVRYDRVITRIEGDRIFLDAPLANSFELQYGGGTVRQYAWRGAIENVGIENLRGDSDFRSPTDEDHAWEFISIGSSLNSERAQNVWVRDITSLHFGDSYVVANPGSKWVTVANATNLQPVSQITGARRYTFDLSGELSLVTGSRADEGRHDFVNNSTRPPGPNVFHDSVATNAHSDSGPHQRWATGTLFDNITVEGNAINARNRGSFGTTHGWSGANMVIWNSVADSFIVQNPPTAQNWLVGSSGTIINEQRFGRHPLGYIDAHGTPVEIESLYEAQLADAAHVTRFHWSGSDGSWSDPAAWREKLAPGGYRVEMRDYLVGDIDDFTADGAGSVDDAFLDPAWETFILGTSPIPITGFDDASENKNVAITIQHQLDPAERVIHGSLAVSLLQSGGDVETDFLRLFDGDENHQLQFSDLGWDAHVNTRNPFVGVVDLGPFTKELQAGSVNVHVSDNTAIDWALYTITVARPLENPPGATVFVEGGQANVDIAVEGVNELNLGGDTMGKLAITSSGALSVADRYVQASKGALEFELGGAEQFGKLSVDGDAFIDGALQVTLGSTFEPLPGQSFEVIQVTGQLAGEFSSTQFPALTSGLAWDVSYYEGGISLDVILAADFDRNGVVGATDYTLWRNSVGSTTELVADADGNGVVDARDYIVWKASYGLANADFSSGNAAAKTETVPEPNAFLLAGWLLLAACKSRVQHTSSRRDSL